MSRDDVIDQSKQEVALGFLALAYESKEQRMAHAEFFLKKKKR